jgi:hypothetical protein
MNYQDLLDKKPSIAKNWITRLHDDDVAINAQLEKVIKGEVTNKSSKSNIIEEINDNSKDWYKVTMYLSDDSIVQSAMGAEAPETEKYVGEQNPALTGKGVTKVQ